VLGLFGPVSADALVLPNEIKEIKNSIQMLRNDVSSIKTNSINTRTAIFSASFMVFGPTSLKRSLISDSGMASIK
jgi:hypothetical protein